MNFPETGDEYPNNYSELMIDLETLSLEPNAAIIQIGAVFFDPRQELYPIGPGFSIRIQASQYAHDPRKAKDYHVSGDTAEWWMKQDEHLRNRVFAGTNSLEHALATFSSWLSQHNTGTPLSELKVWANDPDFDCVILKHAMQYEGEGWPFGYNKLRAMRTRMDGIPEKILEGIAPNDAKHDAYFDAIHQAKKVIAATRWIHSGEGFMQ